MRGPAGRRQTRESQTSNVSAIDVNRSISSQIYALVSQKELLKSVDSGISWATVDFPEISRTNSGVDSVSTHPTNSNTVFVGVYMEGIWKSTDAGVTWRGVHRSSGARNVTFHPLDSSKMFASNWNYVGGILMSTDGGESWSNPQFNYIYPTGFAFHPTDPNRIWVGYSQYWGPPVSKMGVAYSTDGGRTWSRAEFGYGGVSSLVIDPNNPSTLYAAVPWGIWSGVDYSGVWKSTDSGRTWARKNTGLLNTSVSKLVLDSATGSLYAATSTGLFLSQDGAGSWVNLSSTLQRVSSLALTPDGTRLYVGTNGGIYLFGQSSNRPPVASAGPDQTVNEGALVTLDGSGSSDLDGDPLTYQWAQIVGLSVTLNLSDPVRPTFVAPSVPAGGATLIFQLTVSDGQLTSNLDTVNVAVTNVNHPPVTNAGPDQTVNQGSPVTLDGSRSSDPDNDSLTYRWTWPGGSATPESTPRSPCPWGAPPSPWWSTMARWTRHPIRSSLSCGTSHHPPRRQRPLPAPTSTAGTIPT